MSTKNSFSGFAIGVLVSVLILFSAMGGALADRLFVFKPLDLIWPRGKQLEMGSNRSSFQPQTDNEQNVIQTVSKVKSSVVTVSIKKAVQQPGNVIFSPTDGFIQQPGSTQQVQRDIGSGFVVSQADGLIITNRHVVSDPQAEYKIVDSEGKEYDVSKIYRDPTNDLAILQTNAHLPAIDLSDSDQIQVGQTVIAIGTALGEFRQTVTTGVVSGLGRGIDASTGFSSERIDGLIQTDAAINPGNSGGPLLNTHSEVIGINVAVAQAQNIGFAIPINIVKQSLQNFNTTGKFDRPLLGVQYKLIPKETALLNDVPEGAYVTAVLPNSTADKSGIKVGDLITKINDKSLKDQTGGLAPLINQHKIGDNLTIELYRDKKLQTITAVLQGSDQSLATPTPSAAP